MIKKHNMHNSAQCQALFHAKTHRKTPRTIRQLYWGSTRRWKSRQNRITAYRLHIEQPFTIALLLILIHFTFSFNVCLRRFYAQVGDAQAGKYGVSQNLKLTGIALRLTMLALLRQFIDIPALLWSGLKSVFNICNVIAKRISEYVNDD